MSLLRNTRLWIAALLLLFNACKGPQGNPGPQGDTGERGETGQTGATGETGTANVMYSNWINMDNPSKWRRNNPSYWEADINDSRITRDIVNTGAGLVYVKSDISPRIMLLPFTALSSYFTIYSNIAVNRVSIWQQFPQSNAPTSLTLQGWNNYRYVIIPGGVSLGRQGAIDYANYEAVKKVYNLPD